MPENIVCKNCGEVLYEGEILKSPQDVIKKLEGVCPNCGRDLAFNMESVKVQPCNA